MSSLRAPRSLNRPVACTALRPRRGGHCGYESAQSRSSGIFVVVLVGDANNGERPSLQLTDDVKCTQQQSANWQHHFPGLSGDHLGTWLEDKMAAPGQSPRRDGASERRASLSSPPAPPDRPTLASAVHEGL
ncbi:unnamed protein product [Lampetra fluviatilis]